MHTLASANTDFYTALGSMVGGIGAALAFLAAVVVLGIDLRHRRTELSAAATAQAKLVTATAAAKRTAKSVPSPDSPSTLVFRPVLDAFEYEVVNDSALPIFDVRIHLSADGAGGPSVEARIDRIEARTKSPGTEVLPTPYVLEETGAAKGQSFNEMSIGKMFTYMDAASVYWLRCGMESPKRLTSAPS